MGRLFPSIEPYETGMLNVGDGQSVYWEACGNPAGSPVVVLHGGPGSGCTPAARRLFNPSAYRIVLFDQRGCGRSTPRIDATTNLDHITTDRVVADIETLRGHLDVPRWIVTGNSWGATLALAYAERHPEQVKGVVLASVTLTRPQDIHWLYHEVGRYFPEQWQRFRCGVPESERSEDLVAAYHRLLHEQPDLDRRERAASDWCDWEDAMSPLPEGGRNPRYDDPAFRMTFARIVTHFFFHKAWLADNQLLGDTHRLADIPGVLIHGRFDLGSPLDTAWELAEAWPKAELHVVDTGHTGGDEMTTRIIQATERFAALT